jgi:hypothetical protein
LIKKLAILTILSLSIFTGCQPKTSPKEISRKEKVFLTVDFQEGQTLRYKFTSSRNIIIDWDPEQKDSEQRNSATNKSSESVEMVVAYTPIEVDPYGLTTIKADYESVKAERSDSSQKDAVEYFTGKTAVFTVGPAGKIEDFSQLNSLIKEIGEKVFLPETDRGKIKQQDMICDFVATQWFLWDPVSSIEKPTEGLRVGQSWTSKLSVPTPMVSRQARQVTYKLEQIRQSEKGLLGLISSSYSKADSVPESWPVPYFGRFQMSGRFGFLNSYKFLDINGGGKEVFNIDRGRTEEYKQQYKVVVQSSIPLGISGNPVIYIEQTITMKILEDKKLPIKNKKEK